MPQKYRRPGRAASRRWAAKQRTMDSAFLSRTNSINQGPRHISQPLRTAVDEIGWAAIRFHKARGHDAEVAAIMALMRLREAQP